VSELPDRTCLFKKAVKHGMFFLQPNFNLKKRLMKKGFLKNSFLTMAAMLMLWSVVSCTNEDDKLTEGKATIQFK